MEVTLRDVTEDDLEVFLEHQLDPAASRMAAFPSRDRDAHLAHWRTKVLGDETVVAQTILDGDDVAGNVVSWVQDGHREIGYWIGRDHWGRGIATAALARFLELVDERPLYAYVAAHNAGSARVLEKCGFALDHETADGETTHLVYVLHREPLLYTRLAGWWPLLSAPAEYEEEAALYRDLLVEAAAHPVQDVLELGCGGGNNASHMKGAFRMTLTDVAPGMLEVSRRLNPECEHVLGDMRTIRLGRAFDAVFVHDAIDYMTTEGDLAAALATAAIHCKAGGSIVLAPDHLAETFSPSTSHGGHDGEGRALRYVEWTYDPDPADSTYVTDYAYLLREGAEVAVEHDRHVHGLFARSTWMRLLDESGLEGHPVPHTFSDGSSVELFACSKR